MLASPLYYAVVAGFYDVCKLLIDNGANINFIRNINKEGTLLHTCSIIGNYEICVLLFINQYFFTICILLFFLILFVLLVFWIFCVFLFYFLH